MDPALARKGFRQVGADAKLFGRNIEQAGRGALSASVAFRGLGRSVAFASATFLGTAGFVSAVKSSVSAASSLNEQTSKTEIVFGKSADAIKAWSKTAATSMGLAEDQALQTASSFGALFKPIGLIGAASAKQSMKLTQLGADLASFYDTDVSSALDAIRSGLVGESEPLRRYGALLSETRVQQEAMNETGKKTATQLTQQDKVLARLTLIYRDTAVAAGNFALTSGGLANQQRALQANIRNLQIGIGQALIPEVLKITVRMNEWLGKSENQKRVTDTVREAVGLLKDTVAALTPFVKAASGAAEAFADSVGGARNALKLLIATAVAWKAASLVSKFTAISDAAGPKGAQGAVSNLRTSLLNLSKVVVPAIVIPFAAIEISRSKFGKKHHLDYSGIDLAKDIDKIVGFSSATKGILGDVGLYDGPKRYTVKAGAVRPSPDTMTAAETHTPARAYGTTGAGRARANPITGMAALSRSQRNALALAQARTPAQELAALAEQRAILANQIRSVRSRLGKASGSQAKKLADQLRDLEAQDTAAFQQIASINESAARDAKAAAQRIKDAAAAKKKALAEALAKQADARRDSLQDLFRQSKQSREGLRGLTIANLDKLNRESNKASAARALARTQGAQFRALGLTSTGEERAPTRKALLAQTSRIAEALKGTLLDTDKNRNFIAQARKVLNGEWGKLNQDVARRMKEMLDALDPTKQSGDKLFTGRGINLAKVTSIAGLSGAQARAVQFALAGQHLSTMAGAGQGFIGASKPVVIHVHDKSGNPKQTARDVKKELQKESVRGTQQRRGPYAGKRI